MQPTRNRRRACLSSLLGLTLLGLAPGIPAAGRTVIDMAGRRVTLPARIGRIASAGGSPAVNAFLFLFGKGDRIVTGLPPAFKSAAWHFQSVFAPGIETLPVVSGPPPAWTPQVETLLALRPDLSFVVSEVAAQQLERAGLTAIVLKWDRLDSIEHSVRLLAEIFDEAARAQDYLAWAARLQGEISRRIGRPLQRPKVLYLRYATLSQPILLPANRLIKLAGGESVTAGENPLQVDSFAFSVEQILAWQPEVLLLAFGEEAPRLLADRRLADLPAIRNGRIHSVPHGAHIWTHYTPEQTLGVLWLARLLYPERLRGLEPRQEAAHFYTRFFGKRLTDADLATLLP